MKRWQSITFMRRLNFGVAAFCAISAIAAALQHNAVAAVVNLVALAGSARTLADLVDTQWAHTEREHARIEHEIANLRAQVGEWFDLE